MTEPAAFLAAVVLDGAGIVWEAAVALVDAACRVVAWGKFLTEDYPDPWAQ